MLEAERVLWRVLRGGDRRYPSISDILTVEVDMASAAQLLPPQDEPSDEDSLVSARNLRDAEGLRALLVPRAGSVTPGAGGKPQGLGARRVRCEASVAEAVVEERRR